MCSEASQVADYIQNLPLMAAREQQEMSGQRSVFVVVAHSVVSKGCQSCHKDVYARGQNFVFFSSRRRHTRLVSDWSSDVCSSDLDLQRDSHSAESSWRLRDRDQSQ